MRTRRCIECGAESTLFFGFASPCRYNGGSHREIEEVETTEKHEAKKLWAAYHSCMWYDRINFSKHASAEIKALLNRR